MAEWGLIQELNTEKQQAADNNDRCDSATPDPLYHNCQRTTTHTDGVHQLSIDVHAATNLNDPTDWTTWQEPQE